MAMTHARAIPAKVFIGYGGHKGQEIAQDMCRWFRKRGLNAFTVAPAIRDSIPFLESEERILQTLSEFDAAVMICTPGAVGSSRFRDETEKLVYNLELPTIAFVMDGAPVLNILQLRTRVRFIKNCHRKAYRELFHMVSNLLSQGHVVSIPDIGLFRQLEKH
jgi:hypothetical protein